MNYFSLLLNPMRRLNKFGENFATAGFTLIELLVVIVILAILGVVGATIFSGVTTRVQEAERRTEVNSIAKALEVNKNPVSGTYGNPLSASWFTDQRVPTPPEGGNYNISYSSDNTRYRVCSALKDDPGFNNGGCFATSATCFCKEAATGTGGGSESALLAGAFRLQASSTSVSVNNQFTVNILARSDSEPSSLFSAVLSFDPARLEVMSYSTAGSFISNWDEEYYDNVTGEVSFAGGVPNPGYQTSGVDSLFVSLVFRAKTAGSAPINFGSSAIYRTGGANENVLNSTTPVTITVTP